MTNFFYSFFSFSSSFTSFGFSIPFLVNTSSILSSIIWLDPLRPKTTLADHRKYCCFLSSVHPFGWCWDFNKINENTGLVLTDPLLLKAKENFLYLRNLTLPLDLITYSKFSFFQNAAPLHKSLQKLIYIKLKAHFYTFLRCSSLQVSDIVKFVS